MSFCHVRVYVAFIVCVLDSREVIRIARSRSNRARGINYKGKKILPRIPTRTTPFPCLRIFGDVFKNAAKTREIIQIHVFLECFSRVRHIFPHTVAFRYKDTYIRYIFIYILNMTIACTTSRLYIIRHFFFLNFSSTFSLTSIRGKMLLNLLSL